MTALEYARHPAQYDLALNTLIRCTPEIMDSKTGDEFYALQAHCLLHFNRPEQALAALNQLHDTSPEHITRLFIDCYRELNDRQSILNTLLGVENWHQNTYVLFELHQLVMHFETHQQYLDAITILKFDTDWASKESKVTYIARLYEEQAKLMPETSMERMNLLQTSLNTYMCINNFNTRREILRSLAPLHFLMGDYTNALAAYHALSMGDSEQENQNIQQHIQALEAYLSVLHSPNPIMQEKHFTLLEYALKLMHTGHFKQALDFYLAVPEKFKPMAARRDQVTCEVKLGLHQASVVPLSTFALPPSVVTLAQAPAQTQETCYNPEQFYHAAPI